MILELITNSKLDDFTRERNFLKKNFFSQIKNKFLKIYLEIDISFNGVKNVYFISKLFLIN